MALLSVHYHVVLRDRYTSTVGPSTRVSDKRCGYATIADGSVRGARTAGANASSLASGKTGRIKSAGVKRVWSPSVARVLARARFAYLAIETSSGPHVTPVLFGFTPDRLWFGIGRGTLKARVLAKRPRVGVVVPGESTSVAIRGEATLLDGLPPATELMWAPFAVKAFGGQNALEMAAFARDVVQGGAPPRRLAPVSVSIETVALLDGWRADAVLGWMSPEGPIAVPARWRPQPARAVVPAAPLRAAGRARTAAACVCIDESEGPGPLAKRGTLLRGQGHAKLRGDVASVAIQLERVTHWKGFVTQTTAAPGPSKRPPKVAS